METLIILIILLIIIAVIGSLGFLLVLSYYFDQKKCDHRCDQCEDSSCLLNPYNTDF